MRSPDPRAAAGSALVEALVALVLMAIAGTVVAAASVAGLRAAHRAATLTRTTALAARELAALATHASVAESTETLLTVPGFIDPVECTTEVRRDGTVVALALRLSAGRPAEHVSLATRLQVDE